MLRSVVCNTLSYLFAAVFVASFILLAFTTIAFTGAFLYCLIF